MKGRMEEKKTYGSKILEHYAKDLTLDDDVIEYRRQLESDALKEIDSLIEKTKNNSLYRNKDFYIVMLTKMEKIGSVPHNYFLARQSCPTPVYRQAVWKYKHVSGVLEFLWCIPDAILYYHLFHNKQKYLADKECEDLTKFVILMESGELLEWVKRENHEKIDAVIRIGQGDDACQTN